MPSTRSTSAQNIRNGLYKIKWTYDWCYTSYSSSVKYLTSVGVEESYGVTFSLDNSNKFCHKNPSLKLTLKASDKNNFKRRKVTATFLDYEKEMLLCQKGQEEGSCQNKIICFEWLTKWSEIANIGCADCCRNHNVDLCMEIYIEIIDPTSFLERGQQSVLSNLSHLWESKSLADVTFRCEGKDIKAHTFIVSSGSPVLAAMFQNDFKEKQERMAVIEGTKADVFEKLLYFIYTGDLDFEFRDMPALLVAADMYNIVSLKKVCEKYLSENLTVENATNYFILSHLHNAKELYKATLNYMQKNSEAICSREDWMDLFKNYSESGFLTT